MHIHNLTWNSPGQSSSDSMPLGNGEIGLNVWTEPDGSLSLYLARTDAWNENGRPLKLGLIRVELEPRADFTRGFRQSLLLDEGAIEVSAADGVMLRVWADAHAPVVRVEMRAPRPHRVRVRLELWRTHERFLQGSEVSGAYGLEDYPDSILESPDLQLDGGPHSLLWCHRNESSVWPASMRLQSLENLAEVTDPLLHRTFGGLVTGRGFTAVDIRTLASGPVADAIVEIHTHTAQTPTLSLWRQALLDQVTAVQRCQVAQSRTAHTTWWQDFWDRSYIEVSGTPEAESVSRGYALQRFVSACAGRGRFPIKFNGSLFTVETAEPNGVPAGEDAPVYDADYRRWGGPYWFQNTRLIYWPMLAAGDYDLMQPLFQMYRDALPLAIARTRAYFGHGGGFFPETMTSWGGYADSNYGVKRDGLPPSLCVNLYIRHYWQSTLELCELGLRYFSHTADTTFLRDTLLPLATEILFFYEEHYGRDEDGYLRLEPAQALETYWDVVNPTPDIAGLQSVLDGLLRLPEELLPQEKTAAWRKLQEILPPLPRAQTGEGEIIAPAAEVRDEIRNYENPELYAVFPYRRFGLGLPDLDVARRTFRQRRSPETGGWQQHAIQAAFLGLSSEARDMVVQNFATPHKGSRFPAFWGPNHDWVPDQDHGGVACLALQAMLLQHDGNRFSLLPAWPPEWDVRFKLHAPGGVVLEGEFRDGELREHQMTSLRMPGSHSRAAH